MQKPESGRQNKSLRIPPRRGSIWRVCVVALGTSAALAPAALWADGGTLRASQRCGRWQVSVFTSPAVLRVGAIDIGVLVQDPSTGALYDDGAVRIRLRQTAAPFIALEQSATTAAATNKLFRAAIFTVTQSGRWRATVELPDQPSDLEFDIEIAPPRPAWLEFAAWLGWPFVVIVLFCVHQGLKSAAVRKP